MTDGPPRVPIPLAFAARPGAPAVPAPAAGSAVLPAAAGEALHGFFEAHPAVASVQFEIALTENGDDLEFAGGTLHAADGTLLTGRDGVRAADTLRRLLRADPALAALPVALVVAMEGVEHTFRVTRESTGAIAGPA